MLSSTTVTTNQLLDISSQSVVQTAKKSSV